MAQKILLIAALLWLTIKDGYVLGLDSKSTESKDSDKEYSLIGGVINTNGGPGRDNQKNPQYLSLLDDQRHLLKPTTSSPNHYSSRRLHRLRSSPLQAGGPSLVEQAKEPNVRSTVFYDPNEPAQYREIEGSPTDVRTSGDSRINRQPQPQPQIQPFNYPYPVNSYFPFVPPQQPSPYPPIQYPNYGYTPPPGQYIPPNPYLPYYPPSAPRPFEAWGYLPPPPSPPGPYYYGYYPPTFYPPPPYPPPYLHPQPIGGTNQYAHLPPVSAAPSFQNNLNSRASPLLSFGNTKSA